MKTAIETMPGASPLLIHHDRKATAADYVDAVSGTHGVAGAMDTILVLARERGSDRAVLKVTGRDIPEGEYALTSDRSNPLPGTKWDICWEMSRRCSSWPSEPPPVPRRLFYLGSAPSGWRVAGWG